MHTQTHSVKIFTKEYVNYSIMSSIILKQVARRMFQVLSESWLSGLSAGLRILGSDI